MDPRSKNQYFSDILDSKIILDRYAEIYSAALKSIDHHLLENTLETIEQAVANENIIYSIGNGGSASIADHLCCDFSKGTFISGMKNLKSFSLSSNNAILTALSNDIGYEDSFSLKLKFTVRPVTSYLQCPVQEIARILSTPVNRPKNKI